MENTEFLALQVSENSSGGFDRQVVTKQISDLPEGEVLIEVHYSGLNYKDALSASGNRGVTKNFPHTPGIDASGVVVASQVDSISKGASVLVTGFDLGMNTAGGFGQYIRVPAEWVVPLPENLTLKEAMIYGTAGFTASQAVEKVIAHGIKPEDGKILVTGSTGGVGSAATSILAHLGYQVVAATGKADQHDFLRELGVQEIVGRETTVNDSKRPLLKGVWAAVVDNVGGAVLETSLRTVATQGLVTTCGNVAGIKLETTVFPFILRGVTLTGIDSVNCPWPLRLSIWNNLAGAWKTDKLDLLASECTLETLNDQIDLILEGKTKGRVVVNLRESK